MNLSKKLYLIQSILSLLIVFNLALFLWDFFGNFKLYISYLSTNYSFTAIVILIFCLYIALGVGNLMQKNRFIGITFILLLNFSLLYCLPLFNDFSVLSSLLRLSFYFTGSIFLLSYIVLYLWFYQARIQSSAKSSKFTVDCPELRLNRKLIKVAIILGCVLVIILPLAYFAIGCLGKFAGYAFPFYGIILTWGSVLYVVKLTYDFCNRDIIKALSIRQLGIFLYAYGLCIAFLFIFLNIPLWLKIVPVTIGLLLCVHYFVTQLMLFAQIAYAKIITKHYEYKTTEDQDVAARKYKKSMVLGLIISSFIAYQFAMNVKPEFQIFFDQAGYSNVIQAKPATVIVISSASAQKI